MSNAIHLHYEVSGEDFTRAGEASGLVKKTLKKLGYNSDAIRRVAIAMYEAEINMVIHAYSTAPDNVRTLGFGAGMGLPNIKKYTDDMRIETTLGVGTNVYLTVVVNA